MQNDCLWVADCQRLQFTPNQLVPMQLGTGGRESVGRQSNLSSFRSKFIFWLCIQNAKTVVVGEDWSVGKSSYCYPRTAANLRATWAKSSIPNCFCFATTTTTTTTWGLVWVARPKASSGHGLWLWVGGLLAWLVTQPTNYMSVAA